jgi:hypothetical protein
MITVNGTAIAAGLGALAFATLAYSSQFEPVAATVSQPVHTIAPSACDRAVWPYIPQECLRDEREISVSGIRRAGS